MFRDFKEFDNHEYVIAITDQKVGLKAFVAIHTTIPGQAHGGTRLKPYSSEKAAIKDVLELSKAMTYKSALAGLPYGGAKGVIIFDKDSQKKRDEILKAYAKKVNNLNGLFKTGTDVGLTDRDTLLMSRYSKYILGLPKSNHKSMSTSSAAAKGVYYSIKAAAEHKYGSKNLTGLTIGIKGIGKLGGELAVLLADEKANVLVSDIDQDKLIEFGKQNPSVTLIDSKSIHKQPQHIYAPCALGQEFTRKTISELKCDMIVGGANNQLPDLKDGDRLMKRGIIYIPDYIANAGGLIYVSEDLETDGFNASRVEKRLKAIGATVKEVLRQAELSKKPSHRIADKIAVDRILKIKNHDF